MTDSSDQAPVRTVEEEKQDRVLRFSAKPEANKYEEVHISILRFD